ncbi:MAG TPA: hypothetical protein DCO72_04990 [Ruminococcus sp.]|nr:hypothetical protein [Ruminococcus sp.]
MTSDFIFRNVSTNDLILSSTHAVIIMWIPLDFGGNLHFQKKFQKNLKKGLTKSAKCAIIYNVG